MASIIQRGLLAALLLAAAGIAGGQSFDVQSDVGASAAPLAASRVGFSPLPTAAGVSDGSAAPIVMAAISTPSEFVLARSAHKQESSGSGATGVKPWVLVLLGAFLIVTVSQRRATSIMD